MVLFVEYVNAYYDGFNVKNEINLMMRNMRQDRKRKLARQSAKGAGFLLYVKWWITCRYAVHCNILGRVTGGFVTVALNTCTCMVRYALS